MDATVGSVDQTERSVHVEPRATLFPCGSRPSVELSRQRGWMPLSGATTGDGDHFFSRSEVYGTADYSKHICFELYNGTKIARSSFRRERRPSWHRSSLSSRTVTTLHSPRFRRIRRNRIQSGVVTIAAPSSQESVLTSPASYYQRLHRAYSTLVQE